MTQLWELLTKELGSAFGNQYGRAGGHVFNHWKTALSGFTEPQLMRGFQKFIDSGKTYMSLNIFRNHCRAAPRDLGLPDENVVFMALILARWGEMPEQLRIALSPYRYELRQLTEANARKRFKEIYRDVVEKIARGVIFEKPNVPQIASPSGTVHTKNNGLSGQEALNSLLQMFGSKKVRA